MARQLSNHGLKARVRDRVRVRVGVSVSVRVTARARVTRLDSWDCNLYGEA